MKKLMFKRLFLFVLAAFFLFTLYGCGKADQTQNTGLTTENQVEVVEEKDPFYFNIDKIINPSLIRRKDRVSGLYSIRLLKDGKIVEFQTSRDNIPAQLDNLNAIVMEFDADGYIKKIHSAQSALGGQFHDQIRVLSVDGNTLQIDVGSGSLTVAEDASIYDLSGRITEYGAAGLVQENDLIACYVDESNIVNQIYILQRYEDHKEDHVCEHCNTAVQWTEWDGTSELSTGHYCLSNDVALETAQVIKNKDVVLFLNGHDITSKQRVFELTNNATLSVVDHEGAVGNYYGNVIGGGLATKGREAKDLIGGSFYVDKTSALHLYGGNFTTKLPANKSSSINMGGVVYTEGVFVLHGGVVTGIDVGYSAGAVYAGPNSVFKMAGGTMQYGSAYKKEKISGTGRGGTLVIHKDVQLAEITGGKLIAGIVDGHGGGIYTEHNLTISNAELCGDFIDGTTQAEYGGVLWSGGSGTIVDLNEGTVFHSGSSIEGGNIAVRLGCVINVNEGAIIRDGYGSRNGGNAAVFGTLNIKGGQVTDGISDGSGGNIFSYSNGDTFVNILSGKIANGTAARGGNIAMSGTLNYENGSVLNISGGEIVNGVATKYTGGNICVRIHSVANITGGKITGGSAAQLGGGVYAEYTKDSDTRSQLNIGGSAYIFENEVSDVALAENIVIRLLLDEPLKDDAKIGIEAVDVSNAIIMDAYETCLRCFVWTPGGASLVFENDQVFVK